VLRADYSATLAFPFKSSLNLVRPMNINSIVYVCCSVLASLNLPAAIEDLSGEQVPKSVLEKAASVREQGGLGAIDHQLQALPDLLNRNREILDEVSCHSEYIVSGNVTRNYSHRYQGVTL
jgi:hypothetical protein